MAEKVAFFAYPAKPKELGQTITAAVNDANSYSSIKIHVWEQNDIGGVPLTDPIFEKITDGEFLVADITMLNDNVVFEIGYAIGKSKRIFLYQNNALKNEGELATKVGIFDTLGFETYDNSRSLSSLIKKNHDYKPLLNRRPINHQAPVYVVEPRIKGDAINSLMSLLQKARWTCRTFNPTEDIRLAAMDAITHVAQSAGVVCPLLSTNHNEHREHNLRSLFVAGIAIGLEKPTLLIHSTEYLPPLDVRDLTKSYYHPDDLKDIIQEFSLDVNEYSQKAVKAKASERKTLTQLSIGDPTAENESANLANYYLEKDEFARALRGEVNLVVGRKGTGKTALFIQLRDYKASMRSNVIVDLKPEGYQLVKLKEKVLDFLSDGAKQHLITAFWEYLLVVEIIHKILRDDKGLHLIDHRLTKPYTQLSELYGVSDVLAEGDFSERLMTLAEALANDYQKMNASDDSGTITASQVTELIHKKNLRSLSQALTEYLKMKGEVWLLFDNIDKGWNVGGIDGADTYILRCLIDAGRKLERDLRSRGIDFHSVTFIREDVYRLLMDRSSDYGKEMRATLDWSEADILAELLKKRIISSLNRNEKTSMSQVWTEFVVSHYSGEASLQYMIDRSLMRPRNLLKIFKHCLSYAIKMDHDKIEVDDIARGMKAYSQDLLIEVDREISDIFPKAKGVIYEFLDEQTSFEYGDLLTLMNLAGLSDEEGQKVIEFMLYYGLLGIKKAQQESIYIYQANNDPEVINARIRKWGSSVRYVVNPGLWPALNVDNMEQPTLLEQRG